MISKVKSQSNQSGERVVQFTVAMEKGCRAGASPANSRQRRQAACLPYNSPSKLQAVAED